MSRLADEMLNLEPEDWNPVYEDDMEDARREMGRMRAQARACATDEQTVQELNPLGLVASDLEAVGWDSDKTGETWYHEDHGPCTFLEATNLEAQKVGTSDPHRRSA